MRLFVETSKMTALVSDVTSRYGSDATCAYSLARPLRAGLAALFAWHTKRWSRVVVVDGERCILHSLDDMESLGEVRWHGPSAEVTFSESQWWRPSRVVLGDEVVSVMADRDVERLRAALHRGRGNAD